MTDKIEGVPEGWKIKQIGRKNITGSFNYIGENGQVCHVAENVFIPTEIMALKNIVIIERDVKIIDMSKCKVDIEYNNGDDVWYVGKHYDIGFYSASKVRVRQNHYFGWEGEECPLPEGLYIRVTMCEVHEGILNRYSIDALSHKVDFEDPSLVGFYVKGIANGYAYKHEIEGGEE